MNEFSNNTTFNGVRVYALDRNSMVNGGPAHAIGFSILPANLGNQYSLVPASFRTGDPPPAGRPEWFMNVNSSSTAGTVETQVFVRRFHVDFATPANSIFGVGATHSPDGIITVNGFKDAFNASTSNLCPNGTTNSTQRLDTLGDKLMYPLVYQNRGGTESIYADQTIIRAADALTAPTAVRWYQFNMTGNTIPATPAQQQDWNNGGDGLFRWMPSINVDQQGNVAIGYSTSSTTLNPEIRYAGRLAGDPPNNMAQGEATLITSGGHQTSTSGRWGDYSTMFVDPAKLYVLACKRILYCHKQRELGHPHWVVQIPRLRYCTNAYGYTYSNSYVYAYCHCDVHTDCDCNIYAYGYSDLYADSYRYSYVYANGDSASKPDGYSDIYADGYRYSYVYAYRDCDIHTNGDSATKPDGYSDIYADSYRYSYSDANTDASCADGIECYQHNCQWLYSELDQRQRRDQLLVRRRHNQHLCLWHIRAWLPGSQCGQCD